MCIEWVPSWRVSKLVKTFTTFYGMWRFRSMFSVAIFWASLIHCTFSHPVYFKVHWNIDLLRKPTSSELPLSSLFPQQNPVCISFLPHMCYMSCSSHLPSLIALIIFNVEYKWRNSILCIFRHLAVLLAIEAENVFLGILFYKHSLYAPAVVQRYISLNRSESTHNKCRSKQLLI